MQQGLLFYLSIRLYHFKECLMMKNIHESIIFEVRPQLHGMQGYMASD